MSDFSRTPEDLHTGSPGTSPSAVNGGVVCPQCGATNPPGSTICRATPTCGSFLPANDLSVVHRGYARLLLQQPDAQTAMQVEREAVHRDLGSDSSVVKANVINAYIQAKTIRESMFEQMTRTGIKGQAFARFVAILDREMRLASLLGLERSVKRVPSLSEVLTDGE